MSISARWLTQVCITLSLSLLGGACGGELTNESISNDESLRAACNDNNECTADSSGPRKSCINTPVPNGTPCSLGSCQAGVCIAGSGGSSSSGSTSGGSTSGGSTSGGSTSGGSIDCANDATWPAAWVTLENEVLALVNQRRATGFTCGSTYFPPAVPLVMNAELRKAARCHSLDMAQKGYFSHTSQDGRSPWTRIANASYTGSATSENIAAGQTTAAAVVDAWMLYDAPSNWGHCINIMAAGSNELGNGVALLSTSPYGIYWTQDFGFRAGGSTSGSTGSTSGSTGSTSGSTGSTSGSTGSTSGRRVISNAVAVSPTQVVLSFNGTSQTGDSLTIATPSGSTSFSACAARPWSYSSEVGIVNLPPNTAIRFWVKYADGTSSATTSLTMPTLPAASSDLSPPVANTLTLVKDPATGISTASVLATDNIGVASVVFSTNGQQVPVFWDFINWNISAYTDVPLSNGMPGAFKFYQQLPASVSGTSGTLSAVVTDYAGRSTTVSMNANF